MLKMSGHLCKSLAEKSESLWFVPNLLADRAGRSVVIGWENGGVRVVPMTGDYQIMGFGEPVAGEILKGKPPATAEALMSLMTESIQTGETATLFSVIYEAREGRVTVFNILKKLLYIT